MRNTPCVDEKENDPKACVFQLGSEVLKKRVSYAGSCFSKGPLPNLLHVDVSDHTARNPFTKPGQTDDRLTSQFLSGFGAYKLKLRA